MTHAPANILVTGAGGRIGAEIAVELAGPIWHVLVHYRGSEVGATETLSRIRAKGGTGALVQADLNDRAQVHDLMARLTKAHGPVTGLVNNASIFEPDLAQDFDDALWDRHFAIHAHAPITLTRDLAQLLPSGAKGSVVNVLDQRVLHPNPLFFSYTLSKSVLHMATKTLAQALSPHVRVNAVAPGPSLPNARQSQADFQQQVDATLLQTGSPPDQIAKAVAYLLDAETITGQTLAVDGGQHLIWETPDVKGVRE